MKILNKIDIYKIRNRKIQTYKKLWFIINDLYYQEINWNIKEPLYLKNLSDKYKIDHRTIKKYLNEFIFDIWNKKIFIINESDINIIEKTKQNYDLFDFLPKKHKKLVKVLIYHLLWTIQN